MVPKKLPKIFFIDILVTYKSSPPPWHRSYIKQNLNDPTMALGLDKAYWSATSMEPSTRVRP